MASETLQLNITETAVSPLKTLAASRQVSFAKADSYHRQLLEKAFARAEVGLCDYSAVISVDAELTTDFVARSSGEIVFSEPGFSCPPVLRLHARHAIELLLWFQLCPRLNQAQSAAIAILAALAATRFYQQMLLAEREQLSTEIPPWLKRCANSANPLSDEQLVRELAAHLDYLMPLQGVEFDKGLNVDDAIRLALKYAAIARPTEFILTQQGDERLLVDPSTGLNRYGCSPRPRPEAITFSSCTASSVSEYAYRDAELLRHRLMKTLPQENLPEQYHAEIQNVRNTLRQLLDLDALQAELILCSSGTDAELYPLALFRSPREKLVNIVVAPDEVGSGTVQACGGRHFSARTPLGATANGDPIDGVGAESIEVVCIPIRGNGGTNLTQKELKQNIAEAVTDASKRADKIILHLVDNTKTGIVAPDGDFVLALQKTFGSQLLVVVDACQFRLEKANLHRYLAHGFCVLITGSKFFTGAPFAGALLIPTQFKIAEGGSSLPAGFIDYFTRSEVPPVLAVRAENLSPALNFGLLFRWIGALKEMTCFYSVSLPDRITILKTFRRELVASIRANPDLDLIDCPMPHRWLNPDETLWDTQPTIFSFAVRDPREGKAGKSLQIHELKKIYYLLNRNCIEDLPTNTSEQERKLAAQKCHIGQPVTISRCSENGETGALRIAFGARLVTVISYDATIGKNPLERFHQQLSGARTVLAKISLILKYWEVFLREDQIS